MNLLDRRVVLVTGKGGVGKTTVSALIALRAARAGKRVLLCETSGAIQVPPLFRVAGRGYEPVQVAPNLHTLSITSEAAIEDYVVMQLRFRRLYKMVFRNRVVGPFIDAVPGLHDLIQLGKVFDLERSQVGGRSEWDLIVVDAPATGHGLTMLASPRAMMDLTVAGPFHENAKDVTALYEDPKRTALVLVSLPEDMPLKETEQLYHGLGRLQEAVRGLVLNEVHPDPVPDPHLYLLHRDALREGADAAGREAIQIADVGLLRTGRQDDARRRLAALGPRVIDLPFLYRRDLGPSDLASLLPALASL
ncbi:MAG: ArsA family ATPase [Pseudomonadota bacterium]|nr:ArsA family ATPase [Pseudomonadota bacterium]